MARPLSHSDIAILEPDAGEDDYYDTHTVLTDAAIDRWSYRSWFDGVLERID